MARPSLEDLAALHTRNAEASRSRLAASRAELESTPMGRRVITLMQTTIREELDMAAAARDGSYFDWYTAD